MSVVILPHLPLIDEYTDEMLDAEGFYHGFPCVHGHTIRNKKQHWCYHCVHRISQNVCGFDLNYLDKFYKINVKNFLDLVDIQGPDDCWEYLYKVNRHCFPSYRSINGKRTDNMSPMKVMYHVAWGDTGNLYVNRRTDLCDNPRCVNPLHLKTKFNFDIPPKDVQPLVTEYDWMKINHYNNLKKKGLVEKYRIAQTRNHIIHPKLVAEKDKTTFD